MIYRKSKIIDFFNSGNSEETFRQRESKNTSFNDKNFYSKISDIFNCIYEDLFPKIMSIKSKDIFLKEIFEKSMNIIHNNFNNDELQICKLKNIIDKVNEEIKIKINDIRSYLERELRDKDKNEKKICYVNHFRKHCINTADIAYHMCEDGKIGQFIKLESKNINDKKDFCYIICSNCNYCYLGKCIYIYCNYCKKNYYSSILKDNENINILPATWDKYHCGKRTKEIMKCLKCKNILYLDLKSYRLICLNKTCNFSSKPEHIVWGCYLCGADFKSGAKIYNPLEYIILKKVINRALLYKIKAIPSFLPCCKGKIDVKTIFYHNKNCRGQLYKYNLNGRDLVVCEKCQALNKFNNFSWLCPLCSQNFTLNKENKDKLKKHNYSRSCQCIQTEYNPKLNKLKSSINDNNNSSSRSKYFNKSPSSIYRNIYDILFYRKMEENEYTRSKSNDKSNLYKKRNKSELSIKNTSNEEESIGKNYKSIENNKKFRRHFRNKKTLHDILNSRKNTPSFGKNNKEKSIEGDNNLTSRNNYQNKNISTNIDNNFEKDKINDIDNSNYNIQIENKKTKYLFKNKLIYKPMKTDLAENNKNSNILDELKNLKVNKYINSLKKHNNDSKEIFINKKSKGYNNYYNINNINNINIINPIEIKKEKKEDKPNNIFKKIDIINSKNKNLYITTSQNTTFSSNTKQFIRNSINNPVTNKYLNENKLSFIDKRKSKKIFGNTNEPDISFNKTAENFHKKKIQSLNDESINNEIESNKRHNKKIKVEDRFNLNLKSKLNSCGDKVITNNKKIISKLDWKRKRYSNFINEETNLKIGKNNNIKFNMNINKNKSALLTTNENINNISDNCSIPNFDDKDYNYIKLIGEGSYARIYLVEDKKTKEEYALKKVICADYKELLRFKKEFELIYSLQNVNIIRIYKLQIKNLDLTTSSLYVLMERAQTDWNKEIKRRKLAKKFYKESEIISILKQLSRGLLFLQKHKIAHRDIKPQNILIFPNDIYKIADMGEAKEIDKNKKQMATLRGSELFMSPILYEGLKLNHKDIKHNPYKSDMFSLGLCFLYAICLNLKVLEYIREMKDMNSIKYILDIFLDKNRYSDKLIEIIFRMIEPQEDKRIDFEELEIKLINF